MPLDPKRYFTQRGWALLDQCEVTDGPVPYWVKLATLRNNNMLAIFVGTTASPVIPTNIQVGDDELPDMLPTDLLLEGEGYNATFQQYFSAKYNPIRAENDTLLCVMFGGRFYMAMRSSPPSNNPLIVNQNATTIFPKDRLINGDFCRSGGIPCSPALNIQAGLPTNWRNDPVGPPTQLPFAINYGNGKLSKLPLTVEFSQCCFDNVSVDMVDPAGGVTFIQTSAGGTPLQDGYVSPVKANITYAISQTFNVWLDYNDTILAPLADPDGYYSFNIRFTTANCGVYLATLRAPIVAPTGGYVQLISFVKL